MFVHICRSLISIPLNSPYNLNSLVLVSVVNLCKSHDSRINGLRDVDIRWNSMDVPYNCNICSGLNNSEKFGRRQSCLNFEMKRLLLTQWKFPSFKIILYIARYIRVYFTCIRVYLKFLHYISLYVIRNLFIYFYLFIFYYRHLIFIHIIFLTTHFSFEIQETSRKTCSKLLSNRKVTCLLRIIYKCMLYRYLLRHLFLRIHRRCTKFVAFCYFQTRAIALSQRNTQSEKGLFRRTREGWIVVPREGRSSCDPRSSLHLNKI